MDDKVIGVEELQAKLTRNEPVFILDVRPSDQRREWRIAESNHVDAYARLKAGDETALDMVQIPANAEVVTVCAAGKTSLLASGLLIRKGVPSRSLEGGMKAWNYAWNTAEIMLPNDVKVIQVRRPAKGVLSYVAGSRGEAVVIDASLDPEVYLSLAKSNGWDIKYVMDTHLHADYVSRTRELANMANAKHILIENARVDFQFNPVSHGGSIAFGNTALEAIYTPGHTWDSASFRIGNYAIFTGDTLFVDSIGRPDLKADQIEAVRKAKSLYKSLHMILSLADQIMVLPAHTSAAVFFDRKLIGETIRKVNEKVDVKRMSEAQFVEYVLSKVPPAPPNYVTIAELNKKGAHDGGQLAELEAGGNHCSIA